MSKEQQKKYLKEIMEADEKDGLYMSKTPEEYEELIKRIEAYNKSVIDKFVAKKIKELEKGINALPQCEWTTGYEAGLKRSIEILK